MFFKNSNLKLYENNSYLIFDIFLVNKLLQEKLTRSFVLYCQALLLTTILKIILCLHNIMLLFLLSYF